MTRPHLQSKASTKVDQIRLTSCAQCSTSTLPSSKVQCIDLTDHKVYHTVPHSLSQTRHVKNVAHPAAHTMKSCTSHTERRSAFQAGHADGHPSRQQQPQTGCGGCARHPCKRERDPTEIHPARRSGGFDQRRGSTCPRPAGRAQAPGAPPTHGHPHVHVWPRATAPSQQRQARQVPPCPCPALN
jgi:hypothetical protein